MNTLRNILTLAVILATASPMMAQQKRVSPHETISTVIGGRGGCRVTITYGRPYSKDPKTGEMRTIWGKLVPWDNAWRMGADEATMLTTQKPLMIGDTTIPAGAYVLYLVPSESGTTKLAFSTKLGGWGIPVNEKDDLARVDAKKDALEKPVDQFTIAIEKESGGAGGTIKLMWESTQFSVPFTIKK